MVKLIGVGFLICKLLIMSDQKNHNKRFSPWVVNGVSGGVQASLVTLTGYPFDLIKARLQTQRYPTSWECLKGTVRKEGVLGLYRGSSMPWLSHMLKRPIQFAASEYLKTLSGKRNPGKPRYLDNYVIGGVCGLIGPVFGTPLQVVKVAVQTRTDKEVRNSWDYIKSNYRKSGISGFYRGFLPTVMKDSIFGMSFVGSYYSFRDVLGTDRWYKNFLSGASAHCLTWYLFIPIDYVKTNIQRSKKNLTVMQVVKSSYAKHGVKVFWKGVVPACIRTIPVSGVAMTGYEWVRQRLSA